MGQREMLAGFRVLLSYSTIMKSISAILTMLVSWLGLPQRAERKLDQCSLFKSMFSYTKLSFWHICFSSSACYSLIFHSHYCLLNNDSFPERFLTFLFKVGRGDKLQTNDYKTMPTEDGTYSKYLQAWRIETWNSCSFWECIEVVGHLCLFV